MRAARQSRTGRSALTIWFHSEFGVCEVFFVEHRGRTVSCLATVVIAVISSIYWLVNVAYYS